MVVIHEVKDEEQKNIKNISGLEKGFDKSLIAITLTLIFIFQSTSQGSLAIGVRKFKNSYSFSQYSLLLRV